MNAVDLQLSRGQVRNTKAMLMTAIKEQWHPEKYKQRQLISVKQAPSIIAADLLNQ